MEVVAASSGQQTNGFESINTDIKRLQQDPVAPISAIKH